MEKHLHSFLSSDHTNSPSSPCYNIQQSHMEEEYTAELALLQQYKLKPRPEALEQLLQMIAQQSVAEQH